MLVLHSAQQVLFQSEVHVSLVHHHAKHVSEVQQHVHHVQMVLLYSQQDNVLLPVLRVPISQAQDVTPTLLAHQQLSITEQHVQHVAQFAQLALEQLQIVLVALDQHRIYKSPHVHLPVVLDTMFMETSACNVI